MPFRLNKKPYLALLLSLAMPGLGQIYLGQGEVGALIYLVPNLVVVLCFLFSNVVGALSSLVFLCVVYLVSCLKAYYDAKYMRDAPERKYYNHLMVYLLLFALHLAFTAWLTNPNSYLGRNVVLRTFRAGTLNMEPAIRKNDLLITFRRPHEVLNLACGQIVVVRAPGDGHYEIRRIVALAGEHIQLYQGRLYRSGIPLRLEPKEERDGLQLFREFNGISSYWVSYHSQEKHPRGAIWKVPKHHVLALTDRRTQRSDDPAWGPIAEDAIVGTVDFIFIPRGGWRRFGPITYD